MKKMMLMVGAILSLTLFSFTNFQEKRIKVDEMGNYQVNKLKMSEKDIKELMEMTAKFEEMEKGWKTVRVFKEKIKILKVDKLVVVEKSGKKDAEDLTQEARESADRIMGRYLK